MKAYVVVIELKGDNLEQAKQAFSI